MPQRAGEPFEVGLVMAGAVSAGAYTAGVVDYLIEVLDAWEAARAAGAPDCPPHAVRLKVFAGASAGAIVSAMSAVAIHEAHTAVPVGTGADDRWPNGGVFRFRAIDLPFTGLLATPTAAYSAVQFLGSTSVPCAPVRCVWRTVGS